MNMTLEQYIQLVLEFYKETGLPANVMTALKNPKPKYFTYKSVEKYFSLSLAELLAKCYEASGSSMPAIPARGATVPVEDQVNFCGFSLISSTRDKLKQTTVHTLVCSNCNTEILAEATMLRKWFNSGTKYCPGCRGAVKCADSSRLLKHQDLVSNAPYSSLVKVHSLLKSCKQHGRLLLEMKCCGRLKEYNTSTYQQMIKEGQAFSCDFCSYPVSAMESAVDSLLPFKNIDRQQKYSSYAPCSRAWSADFVINGSIFLEVTSGLTDKATYSNNINEKMSWCKENNISIYVVTSLHNVEDIVRSISKEIESHTSIDS